LLPDRRGLTLIKTKDGTEIFFKDWGSGQPIVFHHGWPLSGDDWDTQMLFFVQKGYRVIAHDRRGHGRSTQVGSGHDMDHYAAETSTVAARSRGVARPAPDSIVAIGVVLEIEVSHVRHLPSRHDRRCPHRQPGGHGL
jgi:pimeloyl-ACP methyl ester carboxylesterase